VSATAYDKTVITFQASAVPGYVSVVKCKMPRVIWGWSKRPRKSVFHTLHMMATRKHVKLKTRQIMQTSLFGVCICGGELALT